MRRWISLFVLAGALASCEGFSIYPVRHKVPVKDASFAGVCVKSDGVYEVQEGDVISDVALRCNIDAVKLASYNNLVSPYTIYPGQVLSLHPSSGGAQPVVRKIDVSDVPTPSASVATPKKAPTAKKPKAPKPKKPAPPVTLSFKGKWLFPVRDTQAPLLYGFSKKADGKRPGIGIQGKKGDAILAAEKGKVIYAGNGLVGYGNLVIIKHAHNLVSVYAHNDVIKVKEGDNVSRGQVIASMGDSEADSVRLHFEVRKSGTPSDPTTYLGR